MNRRTVLGLSYAAITAAILGAVWVSFSCWQTENVTISWNLKRRDTCLEIWSWAGRIFALSQIVFFVIAARIKSWPILFVSGGFLFAIAAFIFLLLGMPS